MAASFKCCGHGTSHTIANKRAHCTSKMTALQRNNSTGTLHVNPLTKSSTACSLLSSHQDDRVCILARYHFIFALILFSLILSGSSWLMGMRTFLLSFCDEKRNCWDGILCHHLYFHKKMISNFPYFPFYDYFSLNRVYNCIKTMNVFCTSNKTN